MDLDSLSPLDRLARSRISTASVVGDSSILAEMPPPFELIRDNCPSRTRRNPETPNQALKKQSSSYSAPSIPPSPVPSRSTTLTSENFDLTGYTNDSCQTLDGDDFDWSNTSTSKAGLLSWLQSHPPDLPVTPLNRHMASKSWDVSDRQAVNSPAQAKHHKFSSVWGSTDSIPTPPAQDALSIAVSRGAYFIESGDHEAGVNCWRIAKDGGDIHGRLLYFLAVDAGWTFDVAHKNLGSLMAKIDPNTFRAVLATDCPHIADTLCRYGTLHPSTASVALTLAAAINRAGRPYPERDLFID